MRTVMVNRVKGFVFTVILVLSFHSVAGATGEEQAGKSLFDSVFPVQPGISLSEIKAIYAGMETAICNDEMDSFDLAEERTHSYESNKTTVLTYTPDGQSKSLGFIRFKDVITIVDDVAVDYIIVRSMSRDGFDSYIELISQEDALGEPLEYIPDEFSSRMRVNDNVPDGCLFFWYDETTDEVLVVKYKSLEDNPGNGLVTQRLTGLKYFEMR